ncbi:MAG: hypothetical protein ABR570_05045 [Burkholderiales bacterium]
MKKRILAVSALMLTPLLAQAQATQATYRCTGNDGKKYYGSAIPMQCVGRPVEVLNKQGMVVRRLDAEGEDKERAEKAAAAAKAKEEEAASRETTRRNRALLATYANERDVDQARSRALAENQRALHEVENRIEAIKKRRAGYEKELGFYQDTKGSKPPAKLVDDINNSEVDLKAHEELLAAKHKEFDLINAKYDQDKKRYSELTRHTPR